MSQDPIDDCATDEAAARDLLHAYDLYIATAFEAGLPDMGWAPVCVSEFAEAEYRNVWAGHEEGTNPFEYMLGRDDHEGEPTDEETILRSLSAYRGGSLAIREKPLTDDELDALVTSNDMERRLDPRLPRLIVTHSAHDESEPWGPPDVGGWVAWDASGSESHCEEFHTKEAAIAWLASCEAGDGPVHDWDRAQWEGRMDGGVRDWYTTCYPTDELGGQIDPGLTFRDLARLVGQGFDAFYGRACCGDSVVRERMFAEVARRVGCKYEDVYDACGELRPLTDATLGWPARPCPHEVFAKAKRAAADSAGEVEGASTIKH